MLQGYLKEMGTAKNTASLQTPVISVGRIFYRCLVYIFKSAVQNTLQKPSKTFMLRSGEVEAVKDHYLIPHR
jgi:hypothetical protein